MLLYVQSKNKMRQMSDLEQKFVFPSPPSSAGYRTVCVTLCSSQASLPWWLLLPWAHTDCSQEGKQRFLDSAGCRCKKPCIAVSTAVPVKINVLVVTLVASFICLTGVT